MTDIKQQINSSLLFDSCDGSLDFFSAQRPDMAKNRAYMRQIIRKIVCEDIYNRNKTIIGLFGPISIFYLILNIAVIVITKKTL